jgi:hypothetical protein
MTNTLVLILLIGISILLTCLNAYISYISFKILRVSEALLAETIIIRKETITIREVSVDLRELGAAQVELLQQIPSVKLGSGVRWFKDHEHIGEVMKDKPEGTLLR